jgi:uncharacterized protein (UPF0332 family)
MTIEEQTRDDLIKYRLEQARDAIDVVDLLIRNEKLSTAVNRIYYGMFYSLLALVLQFNFETSKHQQLIGWFNKEFIRPGLIEKEYGRILRDAYEYRTSSDYDSFVVFTKVEILLLFTDMKSFIEKIEIFMKATNGYN